VLWAGHTHRNMCKLNHNSGTCEPHKICFKLHISEHRTPDIVQTYHLKNQQGKCEYSRIYYKLYHPASYMYLGDCFEQKEDKRISKRHKVKLSLCLTN
jgi:hypothetical protein